MIIYKYELPVDGGVKEITGNFRNIRYIESQNGIPMMWIECDKKCKEQTITIVAIGTEWPFDVDENWQYYGSVIDGAGFVWHYYGSPFEPKELN